MLILVKRSVPISPHGFSTLVGLFISSQRSLSFVSQALLAMSSENLLVSETVTVPTMPSGKAPTMVDVMRATSLMCNRFSTAIEAISTRIAQTED